MNHYDLRIDIDRLVLEGFDRRAAESVAHDLKRELARLIAERGLPAAASARLERPLIASRLPAGAGRGVTPGAHVARTIYSQMRGGSR